MLYADQKSPDYLSTAYSSLLIQSGNTTDSSKAQSIADELVADSQGKKITNCWIVETGVSPVSTVFFTVWINRLRNVGAYGFLIWLVIAWERDKNVLLEKYSTTTYYEMQKVLLDGIRSVLQGLPDVYVSERDMTKQAICRCIEEDLDGAALFLNVYSAIARESTLSVSDYNACLTMIQRPRITVEKFTLAVNILLAHPDAWYTLMLLNEIPKITTPFWRKKIIVDSLGKISWTDAEPVCGHLRTCSWLRGFVMPKTTFVCILACLKIEGVLEKQPEFKKVFPLLKPYLWLILKQKTTLYSVFGEYPLYPVLFG